MAKLHLFKIFVLSLTYYLTTKNNIMNPPISLGSYLITRLEVNPNKRDELCTICNKFHKHILNSKLSSKICSLLGMKESELMHVYELIEQWENLTNLK